MKNIALKTTLIVLNYLGNHKGFRSSMSETETKTVHKYHRAHNQWLIDLWYKSRVSPPHVRTILNGHPNCSCSKTLLKLLRYCTSPSVEPWYSYFLHTLFLRVLLYKLFLVNLHFRVFPGRPDLLQLEQGFLEPDCFPTLWWLSNGTI